MTEEQNRLKGIFWGLVVGDCLGSPIQFTGKNDHPRITEMEWCDIFDTPPGYWTDDSSMAFCIADSFVRRKGYDLEDIATNFAFWLKQGFWSSKDEAFDVGEATRSAIQHFLTDGTLKNGDEETQGNGSIMRLAPAFIMNYGNGDNRMLHEISDLTHDSQTVRDTVDRMATVLTELLEGRKPSIRSCYTTRDEVNVSGWAVSTLNAALWALERSDSFEDGMLQAVNLGGDADTIGAVFGQLGGACYGYSSIPERWLVRIKDRRKIDDLIDELIDLRFATRQ